MVSQAHQNQEREDEPATHAPRLSEHEDEQAQEGTTLQAPVLHEIIRREGDDELRRPNSSLARSGLAAGMSMGFSLIAEGIIRASLPDERWATLLSKLGYTVGFIIVIMGRQQLFTENTLTVVLPVMARRGLRTLGNMLRLWGVVLIANLVGALIVALVLRHTAVMDEPARRAFETIGREATEPGFWTVLIKGIFAGWLIALTVWMLPGAQSRLPLILVLTWLVGAANLSHIIAGSVEAMYVALSGAITWGHCIGGYMLPALIGNSIGGVALVAGLNHAQVIAGRREGDGERARGESQRSGDVAAE